MARMHLNFLGKSIPFPFYIRRGRTWQISIKQPKLINQSIATKRIPSLSVDYLDRVQFRISWIFSPFLYLFWENYFRSSDASPTYNYLFSPEGVYFPSSSPSPFPSVLWEMTFGQLNFLFARELFTKDGGELGRYSRDGVIR